MKEQVWTIYRHVQTAASLEGALAVLRSGQAGPQTGSAKVYGGFVVIRHQTGEMHTGYVQECVIEPQREMVVTLDD